MSNAETGQGRLVESSLAGGFVTGIWIEDANVARWTASYRRNQNPEHEESYFTRQVERLTRRFSESRLMLPKVRLEEFDAEPTLDRILLVTSTLATGTTDDYVRAMMAYARMGNLPESEDFFMLNRVIQPKLDVGSKLISDVFGGKLVSSKTQD